MPPKGRCVLWWCNNRQWHNFNTKYYSFPLQEERLKKWLQAIGRNPNESRPSKGICSHHFSPECFELRLSSNEITLKENAVPNVNLYPTNRQKAFNKGQKTNIKTKENDMFDPQMFIIDKRKTFKQLKCCVLECQSKPTVSLPVYMFPKSQFLANLWKATLNIKEDCDPQFLRVCSEHFDERDIIPGTKQLSKLAVPSISVIGTDPEKKNASVDKQITINQPYVSTCTTHVKKSLRSRSTQTASSDQPVVEEKLNSTVITANNVTVILRAKDQELKAKLCSNIKRILKDSTKPKQKDPNAAVLSKIKKEIRSGSMEDREQQKEANAAEINLKIKGEVNDDKSLEGEQKKYVLNTSTYKLEALADSVEKDFTEQPAKTIECPFCGFKMKHTRNLVSHVKKIHYNLFPEPKIINAESINLLASGKVDNIAPKIIKPSNAAEYSPLITNKFPQKYEMCENCGQLVRSNRIKIHLLEVHGQSSDKFVCSICNIQVQTKKILNFHIEKHHKKEIVVKDDLTKRPDKSLSCKYCKKNFPSIAKLRLHEELHSEVQFRCPSCPKKFKGPFSLLLHRKHQHTDSKTAKNTETQKSGILVVMD